MPWILRLLTLIALLAAPLAAPAAAMAPSAMPAANCAAMAPGAAHRLPHGHHHSGAMCCTAIAPAIDPPALARIAPPAGRAKFVPIAEALRLGRGGQVEHRPPRSA